MITQKDIGFIIQDKDSQENKERKSESLKQNEIYNDRLYGYVYDHLKARYSPNTVKEMPVVATLNLCKKVVNNEASIYKGEPEREFNGVSEKQADALNKLYDKMKLDIKLKRANRLYRLQGQTALMIVPNNSGMLEVRNIKQHSYDVVPDPINPSQALIYCISSFDRQMFQKNATDGVNEKIADADDYKASLNRLVFWSKDSNLITDGKGRVLSDEATNTHILGLIPIIDIADDKEDEFFVRSSNNTSDFTIEFCSAMSGLQHVVEMQGFAVGYIIADEAQMPSSLNVGPGRFLKLTYREGDAHQPSAGFLQSNADLAGSQNFIQSMLATWLSTKGLSTKTVTMNATGTQDKFSSGFERMLAKIDELEPSLEDYALFRNTEEKIFEVVKAWVNNYSNTTLLTDPIFSEIGTIPEDATVEVNFVGADSMKTMKEELDEIVTAKENGAASRLDIIKTFWDLDSNEEALEKMKEIDQYGQDQSVVEPAKQPIESGMIENGDSENRLIGREGSSED